MESPIVILFLFIFYLRSVYSLDLSYLKTFVSSLVEDKYADCPSGKTPKEICDENQVMLQLAKMYIISPERVLLLITADSVPEACRGVTETIDKINKTQSGCIPLNSENLYMKLLNTVKFFHSSLCQGDSSVKKKITKIGDCLTQLREEFLDCEGSPDWYENMNQTVRCQVFNDIINCNYVKTAMLCGLESAATIRGFSTELFQQCLPSKSRCKVSRSLPSVTDPMPESANQRHSNSVSLLTSFILLIKIIF